MDFLDKLNPQQREAAIHKDGPLLILAGAGSGKTNTMTHRIAYLMKTFLQLLLQTRQPEK
jgi:DNA helicase-2/ATP-dependent DNA helicase PcrA